MLYFTILDYLYISNNLQMSNSTLIRNYSHSDKDSVLKLVQQNTPKYFAESEEIDLENYLKNEIDLYYVIEIDVKIVGSGGINFDDSMTIAVLSWDIIDPEFQGKSFGSQLLNYRMEQINKIPSVQKIIVRTSQLTYQFYEKQGFKTVEIHKDYWASGFDMYFMVYHKK